MRFVYSWLRLPLFSRNLPAAAGTLCALFASVSIARATPMDAEMKKAFIPGFVSSCIPASRQSGGLTEAQAKEYCGCAAEKSAQLLSQEEVTMAAQGKVETLQAYMPKIRQSSESCMAIMKKRWAGKSGSKK